MKKWKTIDIVYCGLEAALILLLTFMGTRYGANNAVMHLGTAGIFLCAMLFRPEVAGLGVGIGTMLYDLITGNPFLIWSFFIKGLVAVVVSLIAHARGANGEKLVQNLIACLIGAALMLGCWLVAWTVMLSWPAALGNIPASLVNSAIGLVVALPAQPFLRKALRAVLPKP